MRDDDITEEVPDKSNDGDTSEEDKDIEDKVRKVEATARMIFDDKNKTLDMRKRKATDLPQNSKVFLPPPLNPILESGLSVRKQEMMDTFSNFVKDNCDDRGKQLKSSLTQEQKRGLADIRKKTKDDGVVILETDKTGKFASVSQEKFLEMGNKHTKDDKVVDQVELEAIQREANGHVSMWVKMLGMGEAWGHEARIRESLIQHSCVVPPMKLLVKDHKPLGADGLPPTRPVVGASRGINVALSNILSDVIEPISKTIPQSGEVISSEHLINCINTLNDTWSEQQDSPVGGVGEQLPPDPGVEPQLPGDPPVLLATDAAALYPSLDPHLCARIVRKETVKSDLDFEGTNVREMGRYLAMTSDPWEWRKWGVSPFIPWRTSKSGRTPGVTGSEAMGAETESQQWIFPEVSPTKHQVKLLVAACLGVGVLACFRLHTYTFGGRMFQQL